MLQEKILEAAHPYLEGRAVTDLVLGIALIGAQLDGENVGVSYMLRDSLPSGCGSFGFARQEIFQPVARASGARLAFWGHCAIGVGYKHRHGCKTPVSRRLSCAGLNVSQII